MMAAPTSGGTAMTVTVNGLSFHVVDEGAGPPVLLLHGFPDSSALWRHQIPALVDAGHRVIAPDLRGFGESDRPEGVAEYAMPTLVGDVVGILDALGVERADVVGHDWGAGVGWALATMVPQRVQRYVALSVGHPATYCAVGSGVQWTSSATSPDLSRPGALTAALNFRANLTPHAVAGRPGPPLPPVACPVLGVWSDGDVGCGEAQMLASEQSVTGPWRYHRITGAGHWIPLDAPDELSTLLVEFLR
jgi:pimeloyl-ACP methyl ester carboxylesterase